VTLWPLDQIVADTQYYVRDAVIYYTQALGTVSPQIEGRLQFIYDVDAPEITINAPQPTTYLHPEFLTLDFSAVDVGPAGLRSVVADLDGTPVTNGQVIDLYTLALGNHTLTVVATDMAYNQSSASVTFMVDASIQGLVLGVNRFWSEGKIYKQSYRDALLNKLANAQTALNNGQTSKAQKILKDFKNNVAVKQGFLIDPKAGKLLIQDTKWVYDNPH
jgi:hypothetical protein